MWSGAAYRLFSGKTWLQKKKTFAHLITRLNHFLCQALKRRATQKHAYCAVRQYLAQWRLFPRKSHIINNYLCNPEKKKRIVIIYVVRFR
ncbi:BDH_1b_G0044700.mRNA.1.CDS.1 [Saccharomyces cerevisiae]|nr:BDH_1b_G0044700.mRNA.1.CDS.1 [Saccharomyces cerevisiae]CAI4726057.1 BCE_3a_G0044240.mRNA.1.CDS.1 [Saccharomyces cerevisiae]CAI4729002.1 CQS_1a_G0044290.mRNA.1.CDS.1 [Saccharomyces cerevisiae]CAI5303824.1 ALI_HP2_G0043640.mRNA.1.CDS.1 [Saccharomyces cerevisiae]CAI6648874.1 ALI_HP2_G0043640.mRNA.1.CDS.1 [Saccharomyces cerevisiae]